MNPKLKIALGFIAINMQFVGFIGALMFPQVVLASIIDKWIKPHQEGLFMGLDNLTVQVMQSLSLAIISGILQGMGQTNGNAIIVLYLISGLVCGLSTLLFTRVKM